MGIAGVAASFLSALLPTPTFAQSDYIDALIEQIEAQERLRQTVDTICRWHELSLEEMAMELAGVQPVSQENSTFRGRPGRVKRVYRYLNGDELVIRMLKPDGQLVRSAVEYYRVGPDDRMQPWMTVMAQGEGCNIVQARRIDHDDRTVDKTLVVLNGAFKPIGIFQRIDAPVPPGIDPEGVTVAQIDSGVNYTIPAISAHLARTSTGQHLGYDYWDMDPYPYDGDTAGSIFFPQFHGTKVASLLIREAPIVRLIPYRYPRPDMYRLEALVEDAARNKARIALLPMGSRLESDWEAFQRAVERHPELLFIVSSGDSGVDIDKTPLYPAVFNNDNILVVGSSRDDGSIAERANWGATSVDLWVPAENQITVDHMGERTEVSGSSFAVSRVGALAARLAWTKPDWKAQEIKQAVLSRAEALPGGAQYTRFGWIRDPVAQGLIAD